MWKKKKKKKKKKKIYKFFKLDQKEILFKDGMTIYNTKHKLWKAFGRLHVWNN